MMMHTCQRWVLAPTIRIGLKPMTCISKTMSSRWTRMVRALSTRRKEERAITPTPMTSYYAILGCKCRGIHPLEVIKVEMLSGADERTL